MFTDSSAEASALGSGPRGRRFKSALSEKHENDFVVVQLHRGNIQLNAENEGFSSKKAPGNGSLEEEKHCFLRWIVHFCDRVVHQQKLLFSGFRTGRI